MAARTYELDFDGYWRGPNISGIPAKSGIYGVYRCTYDSHTKAVTLKKLIYIGESANMQDRVASHEKLPEWRRKLGQGEELCFNAAHISPATDRERAEAAMIFQHKPDCNSEYKYNFPFNTTTVNTSGKNALMETMFTVRRT
jgi:excinuclease UvrABC nuclease subunit